MLTTLDLPVTLALTTRCSPALRDTSSPHPFHSLLSQCFHLQDEECARTVGLVGHEVHRSLMDLIAVGSESCEVPNENAGPSEADEHDKEIRQIASCCDHRPLNQGQFERTLGETPNDPDGASATARTACTVQPGIGNKLNDETVETRAGPPNALSDSPGNNENNSPQLPRKSLSLDCLRVRGDNTPHVNDTSTHEDDEAREHRATITESELQSITHHYSGARRNIA